MTKTFKLMLLATLVVLASGCEEENQPAPTGNTVKDIFENAAKAQEKLPEAEAGPEQRLVEIAEMPEENVKYDEDLTRDTGMMLYTRANDFIRNPDAHKGHRVKIEGDFKYYCIDGENIFICNVFDQQSCSCCSPSVELEFNLGKDKKFPDDYPARGAHMIIDGTYAPYYTNDYLIPFFENVKILKAD